MELQAFLNWWKEGCFQLVKHKEVLSGGYTWQLWQVYSTDMSTQDYGRHFALLLVLDEKQEILAHDISNDSHTMADEPITQQTEQWFDRHVREGYK